MRHGIPKTRAGAAKPAKMRNKKPLGAKMRVMQARAGKKKKGY